MRRSVKLLLFGIALPGALTSTLYAALSSSDEPEFEVRQVEVDVAREIEAAMAQVEVAVARADGEARVARMVATRVRAPASSRCELGQERSLTLGADLDDVLEIESGSGEIEVEGVEGLSAVRVTATLCASDEDRLGGLDVTLERRGDRVRLDTHYPRSRRSRGDRYARIDLRVEVPRGMDADLRDGSGSISLTALGELTIDDGSGGIGVVGADGSVRIDDGSGEIELRDIAGDVEIQDGSGEMDIRDVGGSVMLTDGSGSIEVTDVMQSVRVRRDGSGSIAVSEVGGDFVVDRDGSGGIRHSRVEGRVDIPKRGR